MSFFSRPTFFHPSHSLTSSLCSRTLWHHPRPPLHSGSPGHHIASPCGISFLGHPIHMHRSTLGHHSNKSSHRHAICWGVVGLAWALGGFFKSTILFPYPQLAPATTKPPTMLPTHTRTSPHQSLRVFCTPLECLC